MNLILLTESDFTATSQCVLRDARALHITSILKSKLGDTLKVGLLNGKMGSASIQTITQQGKAAEVALYDVQLNQAPPAPLAITLFLALPRPRMLGRLLRDVTSLGVKNIHLFHSKKVENSFWQTPELTPDSIHHRLLDGLTQARDTALPTVHLHRTFREVLDTQLPTLLTTHTGVLADPFSPRATPSLTPQKPIALLIGPEGGFTDEERTQILEIGCQPLWLGSRILRVETAVHNAIGRLSDHWELP
ncbi:MAG: 16S rRNA (uracil(1498)-N(3))-methyltransferase [Pseudomonadales bacterium]